MSTFLWWAKKLTSEDSSNLLVVCFTLYNGPWLIANDFWVISEAYISYITILYSIYELWTTSYKAYICVVRAMLIDDEFYSYNSDLLLLISITDCSSLYSLLFIRTRLQQIWRKIQQTEFFDESCSYILSSGLFKWNVEKKERYINGFLRQAWFPVLRAPISQSFSLEAWK